MHPEALDFVKRAIAEYGPFTRILELGSRIVNGSPRDLFYNVRDYVGVDITPGPGVDVVADALIYVPPFEPDLILCTEVLEHCEKWPHLILHARSILPVFGTLVITCATDPRKPHACDGGDLQAAQYYANIRPSTMAQVLELAGFLHWQLHVDRDIGDLYVIARRL